MTENNVYNVVVVDDVVRFPLHLWRYLGRSIGYGIGEIRENAEEFFRNEERVSEPLETADGRFRVWWIPADEKWEEGLKELLETFDEATLRSRVVFLVDVQGSTGDYDCREVYEAIRAQVETQPWLVSSYHREVLPESTKEHGSLAVHPKSPETFKRLEGFLLDQLGTRQADSPSEEALRILVTGAGFEIRHEHESAEHPETADVGFGLPSTGTVLANMGPPFGDDGEIRLERDEDGGFPYPANRAFAPGYPARKMMQQLAEDRHLDEWWNALFEKELVHHLTDATGEEERRQAKRRAQLFEYRMRDAYRKAILKHDWGQMSQSLFAAKLTWCAWLTTNYTRFANRAIARAGDSRFEGRAPGSPWRIVSTGEEAAWLMRSLQDRKGTASSQADFEEYRPLFKLHGDVSHLQTMAIAGYDKELFSALSVPIDSLHPIYVAAEKYLLDRLRREESSTVEWHIVGHDLKDRMLLELIESVVRERGPSRMTFHVVGPQPEAVRNRLRKHLQTTLGVNPTIPEHPPATAEGYLTRMHLRESQAEQASATASGG